MSNTDQPGSAGGDTSPPPESENEIEARRRVHWGYLAGGALILLAIGFGIWALAGSQNQPATPVASVSATPSISPSASPTASSAASASPAATQAEASVPAPPPAEDDTLVVPAIADFAASSETVECADDRSATTPVTLSWSVEGADEVFIGIDTSDAAAQPFATVEPSASSYTAISYACAQEQQLYTLTARNSDGTVSRSITVTRVLP